MKRQASLDDLALFIAIADAGGLAGAARATGVSPPTLGRRMTELEARLGRRLFQRGPRGYALTSDGRALLAQAAPLREIANGIARLSEQQSRHRVRITAGTWTARFIARHVGAVWSPQASWMPEFLSAQAQLDIARREADIGIRNVRPDQSWLSGRMTATIDYAVFARSADVTGHIAVRGDTQPPSARWLAAHHGDAITTTVNDPRLAMDLARAGAGRIVLPRFAARGDPALVQIGPPIDALQHEEWLVAHHEARHDPPVRAALESLAAILTDRSLRPAPQDG
ncbi:LysR family transcriptional regulator [Thalassococcus sp. CAU 1522]|uniref:LysR family transcriptional regulator n=1 Tax=Thalassococcus arenae TaxID=2851652 RepID=A0ABS6N402_9RHOB|nr:LysR family transcriptional regulator [Thalassococcus arenae]MBV2358750.1 LysR family transcriptional regulator [Thalassococcus arenae]